MRSRATCFGECHDAVAEFLVSRGARHHVFSAIAMHDSDALGWALFFNRQDSAAVLRAHLEGG